MVCIAYWVAEDEGLDYTQSLTRQKWEDNHRDRTGKFSQLPRSLIDKYAEKGYANPELFLEHEIAERMASGKTRQQAIEELDKEGVEPLNY
jgi:SOS response regulatory protein OraA/RecX